MHIIRTIIIIICSILCFISEAQIQIALLPYINYKCNGGCNYSGPTIMINEVMTRPFSGNGYIYSANPFNSAGEWIELYNPDRCNAIDISCYFLGNNAPTNNIDYGGGFELPAGTIVPPCGFVIIRGDDAPAVPSNLLIQNGGRTIEIVVTNTSSVCTGGGPKLYFPDGGGWFAFYDQNGVPQDAISWNNLNNSDLNGHPCNPSGNCPYTDTLCSYIDIPPARKTYIDDSMAVFNNSYRRIPDGGSWVINSQAAPTYGTCNAACIPPQVISCDGLVQMIINGGVPPYSFIWDDDLHQTNQAAVNLCAGTYCVTVTDAVGNVATACTMVYDYVPPVTLDTLPVVCANNPSFTLSGGIPSGGVFSGPGTSAGVFNPSVAGPGDHIITYTYKNADSCVNSASRILKVLPLPDITFGPLTPVCINSMPVNLTAFAIPPGGTFYGQSVNGSSFNPGFAGVGNFMLNYICTGINSCTDTAHSVITVNSVPAVTLTPFDSICQNADSVLLTGGSPAGGYFYGNGVISGYFHPSLAGTGNILIVYSFTDTNNCTSTAIQPYMVLTLPALQFNLTTDICVGTPAFILTGGSPSGGTYSGSYVNGGMFDPVAAGIGAHVVTYSLTDTNECTGETSQTMNVRPLPEVWIETFPVVCADDDPLLLTGGHPPGGTYSGPGINNGSFDPLITGTGNFPVNYTYKDQYGCENDSTRDITVYGLPDVFGVFGGGYVCETGQSVSIGLQGSQTMIKYYLYKDGIITGTALQGNGDTIDFGSYSYPGDYTITAVDTVTGCDKQMQGIARISQTEKPLVFLPDSTWLCNPEGVIIDAGNFANDTVSYLWKDGSTDRFFKALQPGIYWVSVERYGCYGYDTTEIKECSDLWIPNVFTPNNDGINDLLVPKIFGDIVQYKIEVFDRWGKKVYKGEDIYDGWNGTRFNNGNDCSEGVYYYSATYKGLGRSNPPEEIRVSGSITLLR